MKIIIISNHPYSIPSIQALAEKNMLSGIASSSVNRDFLIQINKVADDKDVPLIILNPKKLEQQLALFIKKEKVDAAFVFGFSHKISTKLLKLPRWGFINFHPSQLPQFRGPNPIFWQIKNQVKTGGITAHKIDNNWDSGEIIGTLPIPITENMTASRYISEAGFYAMQLMNMILQALQIGQLPSQKQDSTKATYQKHPHKKDLQINWDTQSFSEIRALVNACNRDLGGAITFLRNNPLQILQVSSTDEKTSEKAGTIIDIENSSELLVASHDGNILSIDIVQIAEGIITGSRFIEMAEIKKGEKFT